MDKQKTIKDRFVIEGTGLHTGKKVKLEFLPGSDDVGILFVRKDLKPEAVIKASFYSILSPERFPRRTSIGDNGTQIHTVEHLMAALSILGIDNIQINVWGEEIPGTDGSAKEFVECLEKATIVEGEALRNYLVIREPLWVKEGASTIIVLPHQETRISYSLQYDSSSIGSGYIDVALNGSLSDNFYEARTFCLEEEVNSLLDMGLGKGSNYDNTLVVSEKGIIENELRMPDEFAKHKILDLIGDLYLAGPLKGHVIAMKSGHGLNIKLLERLKKYKEKVTSGGVGSKTYFVPEGSQLNTQEIMKILPHRYPFLLIDRIVQLEAGKRAVGVKNVSMNEQFFQGHFPGRPVMPGVLIIEAMAQVGGVLMLACEENRGKLAFFMAANSAKFRRTVEPGDQLLLEVEAGRIKSKTGTVHAKAFVEGKLVAESELMFALVES